MVVVVGRVGRVGRVGGLVGLGGRVGAEVVGGHGCEVGGWVGKGGGQLGATVVVVGLVGLGLGFLVV